MHFFLFLHEYKYKEFKEGKEFKKCGRRYMLLLKVEFEHVGTDWQVWIIGYALQLLRKWFTTCLSYY